MVKHIVATRFSIYSDFEPRQDHCNPVWLDQRLQLLHQFYLPSLEKVRNRVRIILLCSPQSVEYVQQALKSVDWVEARRRDWLYQENALDKDSTVTWLDSDDAIDARWFDAIETVPAEYQAICTNTMYQYCTKSQQAYFYSTNRSLPLLALRGGITPYENGHHEIPSHYHHVYLDTPYLLQVVHGGNVMNQIKAESEPVSNDILSSFGLKNH